MFTRWLHYILPIALLITAGVVAVGGIYATSRMNQMVSLEVGSEQMTNLSASLNAILMDTRKAEEALEKFITTHEPAQRAIYDNSFHHAWVHIGNLWDLNRNLELSGIYELQSALWSLHTELDKQIVQAETNHKSRGWKFLRRKFMERLKTQAYIVRWNVTQLQAKNSDEKTISALSFRLAVFLTPILSTLMLLIAFQYIYRTQRKEREEAQAVNQAKSQFLANMSHEIRTPLAAVLGFSDVLSQPGLAREKRAECIAALKRNGQLLLKIVDDILDLSKIEARKVEFKCVDFDLGEVFDDVESAMALRAGDSGIHLTTRIDRSARERFHSDPVRIKQILLNIIGNAIKFTREGVVTVSAEVRSDHLLRVEVADSGIGISFQQMQQLFQPFTQASSSNDRKFGGTGLGLSISRQLAQAMGGDVKLLSSRVGKGSIFEITLKLEKASAPAAEETKTASVHELPIHWREKSVLVVDDSEDNRHLVSFYLQPTGVRVIEARSGDEAIDIVQAEELDLILMDIQMPVKSGYETTRQIRQMGVRKPIIAFTAHAMAEEAARCRASGCDNILTKPIFRENLLNLLDRYL